MNKYFNYIVLGLLVIIFIQGFLKAPEGISEEEEMYRIKIHDLNQEKIILLQKIDTLKNQYEVIKKNVSADSLFIWTADRSTRDSIRAIVNPR